MTTPIGRFYTEPVTEIFPTLQIARADPPPSKDSDASLRRSGGLMAIANLTSRITGFLRQILLFTVLGASVLNDSYAVSNTLPTIVYEFLIGGVLSSVMIPLLVRAQQDDPDGGERYTRLLFTLAGAALLVATTFAMLAAPLLTRLYVGGETTNTANPELATAFAYLLLPQILFYGLGALMGAVLNTKGSFGAFAWAPVLNNAVVLAMLVVFLLVPGQISVDPVRMGEPKLLVLGIGTTLGILAQTLVLIPALRRVGFSFRPVWGWDPRMTATGGLALWAVTYVLIGAIGLNVTTRIATSSAAGAYVVYVNSWLLLQVPYGVLGVSLLTALMPRMSRAAAEGRTADVLDDLSLGSRLSVVFLLPIAALFTAFGPAIGTALFGLRADVDGARLIGLALAWSAFGLVPYAITLLQLRVFYALTDSRTPVLIQLFTVAVKVPLLLVCPLLLAPEDVVLGLVVANGLAFAAGAVVGQVLLRRRLGGVRTADVANTTWRTLVAAAAAAVLARGLVALLDGVLSGASPLAGAWVQVLAGTVLWLPLTVVGLRLLQVSEVGPVTSRLARLVSRFDPRRGRGG